MLTSPRLRLRALEVGTDSPTLYRWENNREAWFSAGTLNPLSSSFIDQYITHSSTSIVEQGQLSLMIETLHGISIGYIHLSEFSPIERRIAIGIYIAPEHRGLGYSTEAMELVLQQYIFTTLRCRLVFARVLESNIPSRKMLVRLGFCHTATLPEWAWDGVAYQALNYYQLWSK